MKFKLLVLSGIFAVLTSMGTAFADGDASAGEAKAASCGGCHGADGMGNADNPPIAGLEAAYFVEQMAAYKSGARENAMMQMFAGQLSDEDMADLAAYYSTLNCD